MEKNKSKILGFMFFTLCLIVQLCIGGRALEVNAETTTLEAGKTYSLSFQTGTIPHLRFVMPAKGYFYYQVAPTYYEKDGKRYENSFYIGTRMMVNNKIYEDKLFTYNGDWETSSKYAFKKGTVIDFSIPSAWTGIPDSIVHYDIKFTVVKPKNFEKENNNSKKAANTVKRGKTYLGLVMVGDTDYYVFKAPKTGKYKITTTVSSAARDYDNLTIEAFKGTKRVGYTYTYYGKGYETVWKGKLKKGQKIYIKFSGPSPSVYNGDLMYKLKIK